MYAEKKTNETGKIMNKILKNNQTPGEYCIKIKKRLFESASFMF